MAGIMHKIGETLHMGGKKEEQQGEHKGETQAQHNAHAGTGAGGYPMEHKGETQAQHNAHTGTGTGAGAYPVAGGEHKEGFMDKIKDKLPGGGEKGQGHGETGEKKKKKEKKKKEDGHDSSSSSDSD